MLRVLLISHTCQSRTEGQPKAECLARLGDIELLVLAPDRWLHYGAWREADAPADAGFAFRAGRVAWPWVGPAQSYLHWYPELPQILRDFRPHVIDLWEEPWSLVSGQACWLRNRLLPETRIVTETEQNIDKQLPPPFEQLRGYTLRNADYAVGRNADAIEILRHKGYRGRAEVIGNAVDPALFRPLERDRCRRELGLEGFVAGYVGRMVEEKGLIDLLEAMPLTQSEVGLLLVGSGPLEPVLAERIRTLGLESRVKQLPGQPLEALPSLMNALDVLALPSRTTARWKEQFGRVIIEAQACGVPVIGSSSGAIPDVVGEGGWIVPEGRPAALAAALDEAAGDITATRDRGRRGRQRVLAEFTWERVAEQMRDVYRRAAEPRPARTAVAADSA